MKTVTKLLACTLGLFAASQVSAQTVVSDPVGFYKLPISLGFNDLSAPMQPLAAYRGTVASVSGTNITFTTPGFTPGAFNRVTNGANLFNQYIMIVRNDLTANSTIPTGVATNNITGDWWPIMENDGTSVSVNPNGEVMATTLQVGDTMEIRKLTSLADLVGLPGASIMNTNGASNFEAGGGDTIYVLNGSSFAAKIVLNSALGQYRIGGLNLSNGTTYTFEPNDAFIYKRVDRTSLGLPAGTNIVTLGQVQTKPLTQYFGPSPTAFANQFPANQIYSSTGLKDLILFAGANSVNQFFIEGTEDGIIELVGTGFGAKVVYATAASSGLVPAFRAGAAVKDGDPIIPGRGYLYYCKTGTGGRVWRQPVPFTP